MGMLAKMFTVRVGVVAAGVAEVMDTSHYTSSTLDITIPILLAALSVLCHYTSSTSPTLAVLCRHAALLSTSPDDYCCVAALTIISIIDALVPTSIMIVKISTSVTVLDHC